MKRTLVSALDWGLGHTTRVIPVIKELVDNGDEVIIGASRRQATIFREFFPNVKIIELSSVAPIYSESSSQLFSMASANTIDRHRGKLFSSLVIWHLNFQARAF